jgi:hypothetical protein
VRAGAHDAITRDVLEVTGYRPRTFGAFAREHADAFTVGK